MKPHLFDLFCGAGGCSMGYYRAGFDITGVDIADQPRYPFKFIRADALEVFDPDFWLLGGIGDFDAIHASPPCQFATSLRTMPNAREHENLIPETRRLLQATGLPYVIENVEHARPHLHHPFRLCGSSFGLGVWRHRLFETNWLIGMIPPCSHTEHVEPLDVTGTGGPGGRHRKPSSILQARDAMGIDWMNRRELSQAIPPAYTELIGHQLMQHVQAMAAA